MSYQQEQGTIHQSQSLPPEFAILNPILLQYGKWIQKGANCCAEPHTMLAKIAFGLGFIPFELHGPFRTTIM